MSARWVFFAMALVVITSQPVLPQNDKSTAKPVPRDRNPTSSDSPRTDEKSIGEQKFQQNCSRCHNAPEGFSSHISGTIVKHMRVRASLSEHDAREILRYLNPQ